MGVTCEKFRKKGHFAKCCQTKALKSPPRSRKVIKAPAQRIQRIEEWVDSSSGSVVEDDKIGLTVDGEENGQFSKSGTL